MGPASIRQNHVAPGLHGNLGSLQFCHHAAGADDTARAAGHGQQIIVHIRHLADKVGIFIRLRRGGIKPVNI